MRFIETDKSLGCMRELRLACLHRVPDSRRFQRCCSSWDGLAVRLRLLFEDEFEVGRVDDFVALTPTTEKYVPLAKLRCPECNGD
jgi:hypothetical protein